MTTRGKVVSMGKRAEIEASMIKLYRRVQQLHALAESVAVEVDAMAEALGLPGDYVMRRAAEIDATDEHDEKEE
jgi:hypothetical protein